MKIINQDISRYIDDSELLNIKMPISLGVKISKNIRTLNNLYFDFVNEVRLLEKKYGMLVTNLDPEDINFFDLSIAYHDLCYREIEIDLLEITIDELESLELNYKNIDSLSIMISEQ